MELTCFLEKVASATPTPGGGSVSAMAGALSASLVAMVSGLSSRGEAFRKEEMRKIRREALTLQKRLFLAIEEDAGSFDAVMDALRLPKETGNEKTRRRKAIQKAYQNATVVPRRVCQASIRLLELGGVLLSKGNPNAWSDTGVAIGVAKASLEGGLLNVRINRGAIVDQRVRKEMGLWIKGIERKRDKLLAPIEKQMMARSV